jgi:hypothetical protein
MRWPQVGLALLLDESTSMKLRFSDIRPGVLVKGHNDWYRRILDVRDADVTYVHYFNLQDAEGMPGSCRVSTICQWGAEIVDEPDADTEANMRKAADARLLYHHGFLVEQLREIEHHLRSAGIPFEPYRPSDAKDER